nr:MAG TPA: hypothetical protein [Caudoviricetes sp.]
MFMQEMEYIAVDIPHFVISLFIYTMLIIQNQSYTIGLSPM